MKQLILFLFCCLIAHHILFSQNIPSKDAIKFCEYYSLNKDYKVIKIRNVKNAYLIDLTDSSEKCFFTIISLKSKYKQGKQIKKGRIYKFQLNSYYPYEQNVIYIDSFRQAYFEINGISVYIPHKVSRGQIVTTPNLKGLYYLGTE